MLDLCRLGKENGPWGRDREIWGGGAQKDSSERAPGLSGRSGSFFLEGGTERSFPMPQTVPKIY